jgi:DNA repair protein RecO (recombination protein O)
MAAPQNPVRVELEPAWLLRTVHWRETSLIVEVFSRHYGRVGLVAKGARRPHSQFRGLLAGFQPLLLNWSGKNELKTLARAEWQPGQPLLSGQALLCAYYLNELVLKLTAREDPHPGLFVAYVAALGRLAQKGVSLSRTLRQFELTLLREIGLGVQLGVRADTGEPLTPEGDYVCLADKGVLPSTLVCEEGLAPYPLETYPGQALLAIAQNELGDSRTLTFAKRLTARLLDHHLDGQTLQTRRIFMELSKA